jgi:hypothetical protein
MIDADGVMTANEMTLEQYNKLLDRYFSSFLSDDFLGI